jgi:DNA repair protein RecO (recombination protein O)
MAIDKAEAIVLHSRKQGETSKILSLFTREYGKMSVMVKGSRSLKSRYWGVLETLNHIAIVFYYKETRELQYVSQAEIINSFPNLHSQLGKMALAAIPSEIVERAERPGHVNLPLFSLLAETLQALEKEESGLRNIVRAFELKFAALAGFKPALAECAFCKQERVTEYNFFALDRGAYSCQNCGLRIEPSAKISGQALELLRRLDSVPVTAACQAKISGPLGKEVDGFLLAYLRYHLDGLQQLKSVAYLEQLQAGLGNQN